MGLLSVLWAVVCGLLSMYVWHWLQYEDGGQDCLNVLIVGGGPVGLLYAIEAASRGGCVVVVEKRSHYTRAVWFDLYSQPWYPSIDILHTLGFNNNTAAPYQTTNLTHNIQAITIQAKTLETFLLQAARKHNVTVLTDMLYLHSSLSQHRNNKHQAILRNNKDGTITHLPFDILVAADGAKSTVREEFGIPFQPVHSFNIGLTNQTVSVPGIQQVSVIVDFKLHSHPVTGERSCPKERIKDKHSGDTLHPWYASLKIPGVSSVFKRFYFGHCQMQILVDRSVGEKLLSEPESTLVWNILSSVCDLYLEGNNSSEFDAWREIDPKDISIHPIRIHAAVQTTKSIASKKTGLIIITGDASFTAHYRLGIGINTGFALTKSFGDMIETLVQRNYDVENIRIVGEIRERVARERLQRVLDIQLSTMFLETYCGFAVFFDPGIDDMRAAQMPHKIDIGNSNFNPVTLEDISQCVDNFSL